RVLVLPVVLAIAVEPAVRGRLHAGRAGLHIVLRVEVAARRVGGADRVDRGETLRVPQRLEGREARVQAEIAVEIDDVRLGHGDARPLAVVQRVAVRYDHVEPVHGAALEEANQDGAATGGNGRQGFVRAKGGPGQEQRVHAEAEQGHSSRLHEDTS